MLDISKECYNCSTLFSEIILTFILIQVICSNLPKNLEGLIENAEKNLQGTN